MAVAGAVRPRHQPRGHGSAAAWPLPHPRCVIFSIRVPARGQQRTPPHGPGRGLAASASAAGAGDEVVYLSGGDKAVRKVIVEAGTGEVPRAGAKVEIEYTGAISGARSLQGAMPPRAVEAG